MEFSSGKNFVILQFIYLLLMPDIAVNLDIEKDNTIRDVEGYFAKLNDDISEVNIKLPRHHRMTLFKDSWITSLIATASRGRRLNITDWNSVMDQTQIKNRFSNSLIGITSAFMADEISNVRHEKYNIDINEIIEHIVFDQNGVIEDSESGKAYVFCSFDSTDEYENFPRPLALTSSTKEEFIRKFLDFKREKIDSTSKSTGQLHFAYPAEWDLPSLIFELYENTNQHGRYDGSNNIIKGVRAFSIRRHIANNYTNLVEQAEEFEELQKYIESIGVKRNLRFYEISITDNGMGIVDRLLGTRPELVKGVGFEQMSPADKLNFIISRTLSSKLYPGSGLGLITALRNLEKMRGFLSLRTGDQWVFFDGNRKSAGQLKLVPIKNTESLSKITGTHYNILIPAT